MGSVMQSKLLSNISIRTYSLTSSILVEQGYYVGCCFLFFYHPKIGLKVFIKDWRISVNATTINTN
jgi:hypothetical protein